MALNLMIDSNVALDKLLRREPFYEKSNLACMLGLMGDANNYLSVSMLSDIYYSLSRKVGSTKAQDMLVDSLSYLDFCDVSTQDGIDCLNQRWDDFEDCLVARCAENVKADYIITRNPKDFTRSTVPAITPAELFELLETRDGLTYQEYDLSEYF